MKKIDYNYKSDEFLVDRIQKYNCEDSLKMLCVRHAPLCYKIFKKYIPSFSVKNINFDEVYQEKDYVVYKSAKTFKQSKNVKFSTWLGNQIRYHCLNTINKKDNIIYMETKDIGNIIDKQYQENINSNKLNELKDYITSLLEQLKDDRISKIFNMRYFETSSNQTWTKIGKKMNMSTQNAINLHNKGVQILKNKLTSKDLFDKI